MKNYAIKIEQPYHVKLEKLGVSIYKELERIYRQYKGYYEFSKIA